MDATGFVLSIAFALVKPPPRQALSARHGLILNEPRPGVGVVECAQRAAFALSIHPPYWLKSLIWQRWRARRGYQQNLSIRLCITSRQNMQALDMPAIFTSRSKLGRSRHWYPGIRTAPPIDHAPRPRQVHSRRPVRPRALPRAIAAANAAFCAKRGAPSSPSPTAAGRRAC